MREMARASDTAWRRTVVVTAICSARDTTALQDTPTPSHASATSPTVMGSRNAAMARRHRRCMRDDSACRAITSSSTPNALHCGTTGGSLPRP
jgi:hypothetical protein